VIRRRGTGTRTLTSAMPGGAGTLTIVVWRGSTRPRSLASAVVRLVVSMGLRVTASRVALACRSRSIRALVLALSPSVTLSRPVRRSVRAQLGRGVYVLFGRSVVFMPDTAIRTRRINAVFSRGSSVVRGQSTGARTRGSFPRVWRNSDDQAPLSQRLVPVAVSAGRESGQVSCHDRPADDRGRRLHCDRSCTVDRTNRNL